MTFTAARQVPFPLAACDRRRIPRYSARCLRCGRYLRSRAACPRCAPDLAPGQRWETRRGDVHEVAAVRGDRALLRWEGGSAEWLSAWIIQQLAAEGRWVLVEPAGTAGGSAPT